MLSTKKQEKSVTPAEFYEYKTKITRRAIQRTAKFQDEGNNYYWTKLRELESIEYNYFKQLESEEVYENIK